MAAAAARYETSVRVNLVVNDGGGFDLGQVREQCAFEVSPPDSHN